MLTLKFNDRPSLFLASILLCLLTSCAYNTIAPPPQPYVPQETDQLVARYTAIPPGSPTDPYWATVDYMPISVDDISIENIPAEDGLLNTTGTYRGLADVNNGNDPELLAQAAYDDNNIYIRLEWKDRRYDMSQGNWLYLGPEDPLKSDNADAWTSQRNDDKAILAFTRNANQRDLWKWSLALSEPLGYAQDMHEVDGEERKDAGDEMAIRNTTQGGSFRAGPEFEWNGEDQILDRELSGTTALDAGFYLLDDYKMPLIGNIVSGEELYQSKCASCHGVNKDGDGFDWPTGVALNIEGDLTRISREGLDALIVSSQHSGNSYYKNLTQEEKDDLLLALKSYCGLPANVLKKPTGSNADIFATSNVLLGKINPNTKDIQYEIMLVRPLNTGHDDDIRFDPSEASEYTFSIYITNNDELNKIGSENESIRFVNR